ncbi:MAG: CinA family protein [Chloroflexota bacterium]|nr:CinA family protein [Chloroflexota bacterium]
MQEILQVAAILIEQGTTLSTAESCTGGLLGHLLTNVPGSSRWYRGGAITYSDALKRDVLAVRRDTLERFGAVSSEVAEQMAVGARKAFDTDYAISITGIAGPGGHTPTKPVGLTYIGVATLEHVLVRRFIWEGSREGNKQSSAGEAISLFLELLQEKDVPVKQPEQQNAAVEAVFEPDGAIRPLAFVWKGRSMEVTDRGREWRSDDTHHFLVMTADNRVWELRFESAALRWTIHPKTEARYVV